MINLAWIGFLPRKTVCPLLLFLFYNTTKLWTLQLSLIAAILKVPVIRPELLQVGLLP